MPRSKVENEKIRQAAQANLLRSAMTLFAQHGYANTSIRRIAEHANISVGLMYHYFDSKESLLRAVFENCMVTLSEAFDQAYQAVAPPQRLANLLRAMFELLERDREFWALFYMMRNQPAILEILGDGFRLWTGRLRALFVTELAAAGTEEPETDAYLLYSLIEGTIQQYLLDPDNYPLEHVVRSIVASYAPM